MPIVPPQIRSADPWCENRYSDNYNLRNRVYTFGENVIVRENSFSLSITNNGKVQVSPGMCFIDDVFIHVTQSFILDPLNQNHYFSDSTTVNNGKVLIYLQYNYVRSLPPPKLYAGFKNISMFSRNDQTELFLGYAVIQNGIVIEVGRGPIMLDTGDVINTTITDVSGLTIDFNGGVIDYIQDGNYYLWLDNWIGV